MGRLAVTAVAVLAATACASKSGSDTPAGGAGGASGGDGGQDIFGVLMIPRPATKTADGQPTPTPFYFDQVPAPYAAGDAAACKAFSSADLPAGDHADIRSCTCDKCFQLQQACDALQGCQQIAKCGMDINCKDANTCYLGPAKTPLDPQGKGCVEVTDKWGNAGSAAALSLQLSSCAYANSCRH
jgi:hypothetical protein